MSWEVYALSIFALLAGDSEVFADNAILNQYLEYLKIYSVEQINYIPTAVSGIAIVANLLFSWYADWFKSDDGRAHVGILLSITGLISGAIMLNPSSVNAKLFALFLNGIQLGFRSVLFAWANDICQKDDAKRAIVIGFMNAMSKSAFTVLTYIL
jgi:ACS family pantothenate transporter-like MFS transporter